MDYGNKLPFAGIVLGGVLLPGPALLGIIAIGVAAVALAIRFAFRRGKEATQP